MPPRRRSSEPLVPWTDLRPSRDGVALTGAALLGHLHWWREGSPAPDLEVAGAESAAGVDWSGFPASPPAGYETAPGKRRPGKSGTEKRKRNAVTISLTDEELVQLEELAKGCGGSLSGAVKGLLAKARHPFA